MLLPAHRSPLQKPLRGAGLLPIDPYLALYQQAVVLYSLRKTTPQATRAIRIRRDIDSLEQDIGFIGKDLDQQAIEDFATTGAISDCTIVKWYDQISNNDSIQNNGALQPKIYDVTTGEVTKETGKPAAIFDGAGDNVPIINVAGRSNIDAYLVNRHDDSSSTSVNVNAYAYFTFFRTDLSSSLFGYVASLNSTGTFLHASYGTPNLHKNNVLLSPTNRSEVYTFLGQTQNIVNHQGVDLSTWASCKFGSYANSASFHFEGSLQEIIVFADNLTTQERQLLHDDINNYYGIY